MDDRSHLAQQPLQARVQIQTPQLVPFEPPEGAALLRLHHRRGALGGDRQVAQVEMVVSRFGTPGRNGVHVHVEGPRCRGVQGEARDPGLFERLAKGYGLSRLLAGIAMTARLEPTLELTVMQEQDAVAGRRDDDRAPGEMAFEDPAIEGVVVTGHETKDVVPVRSFQVVRGREVMQPARQQRSRRGVETHGHVL